MEHGLEKSTLWSIEEGLKTSEKIKALEEATTRLREKREATEGPKGSEAKDRPKGKQSKGSPQLPILRIDCPL